MMYSSIHKQIMLIAVKHMLIFHNLLYIATVCLINWIVCRFIEIK